MFDNSIHVVINHVNNAFEVLQVVCFTPYQAMFNNMTRGNTTYEDFFKFSLKPNRPCLIYRRSTNAAPIIHRLTIFTISKCNRVLSYIHSSPITYLTYTNPNNMRILCENLSTFFSYNFAYFVSLFWVFIGYCFFFPIFPSLILIYFQNKQIQILDLE